MLQTVENNILTVGGLPLSQRSSIGTQNLIFQFYVGIYHDKSGQRSTDRGHIDLLCGRCCNGRDYVDRERITIYRLSLDTTQTAQLDRSTEVILHVQKAILTNLNGGPAVNGILSGRQLCYRHLIKIDLDRTNGMLCERYNIGGHVGTGHGIDRLCRSGLNGIGCGLL